MSPPNFNPSARERFFRDEKMISVHRDLVGDKNFNDIIDVAKLEYLRKMVSATQSPDPAACAAAFNRLAGMDEFVSELKKLTQANGLPKSAIESLNYRV
jgi:hypothetical protein